MMAQDNDRTTQSSHFTSGAIDPLALVRAYWEGLRVDVSIPLRGDVSPRGIEAALSSTFLIERVGTGLARCRIAGMNLTDLIGMEARGMPISAFFSTEARPELAIHLEQIFATPAVLTLDLAAIQELGRPALAARLLALPLLDHKGRCNLALGCLATTGNIGRSPRRFSIDRAVLTPLVKPAVKTPTPAAKLFAPQIVARNTPKSFAEPAAGFDHSISKKPHLRLVK
jgi:hypothetical protein